jgi:4-carboxymuconolactone decarboxylase
MRLPRLTPEQYSLAQRELAERIGGKRGKVAGPFTCWLHSPQLCNRIESLATYVRFESALSEKLRELCLLLTARYWGAQDSWNAHTDKAKATGVSAEVISAMAENRPPPFGSREETVLYEFSKELLESGFVSEAAFSAALSEFGTQGVVDLVGCLGTFTMMALCLNAFQVDLDPTKTSPFPDLSGYTRVAPRQPLG